MAQSGLLGLASAAPGAVAAAALVRFFVWPSRACTGLFLGLVIWKRRTLLAESIGPSLPKAGLLGAALVGLGVAVVTIRAAASLLASRKDAQKWDGPEKPLLLPCRTTHTRMFPKRHSFSYSYLVVGIPVGWSGASGSLLSADLPPSSTWLSWLWPSSATAKAWYHVDAADYLERGKAHLGLRGKLDEYLTSLGVDPGLYPRAYLLTAAKFLGYHFNPVSFWYLYGPDKEMAAMILEVNNTFGERRMYFLPPSAPDTDRQISDSTIFESEPLIRLKQQWPKDFHVSPFNSRKGSYTLDAHDVLAPGMRGPGNVDITVVLRSSKTHGKLVAKLFSEGQNIDPANLNLWQRILFVSRWWWVGFVTFPRIVKEAGLLFFRRKLHVWFRPEPLKQTVGRLAEETERDLETVFRIYLKHLVEQCESALAVRYIPAGGPDSTHEMMLSPSACACSGKAEELEFKVLTPVFYSRFVRYAHDLEAFFCELRESNTIWLSKPQVLPQLALRKQPSPPLSAASYLDFASFKVIQRLRKRPERIERPLTSSQLASKGSSNQDLRGFRISSMDAFVLSEANEQIKSTYRNSVLKLFLADTMSFGIIPLLELQQFVLRAVITWVVASQLF